MADVFLSDVHLRLDFPERGNRLASFVETLAATDRLWIVGDLCDFWMSSRQRKVDPEQCPGLSALQRFQSRGGALAILVGNHDAWMAPEYARWFGIGVTPEPLRMTCYGNRLVVSHGHRVKGKSWWKAAMESRAFLHAFASTPAALAERLDQRLAASNERTRVQSEPRMIEEYRLNADQIAGCDIAIFGHVHRVHDDASRTPRLVVLGDWIEGWSYLRLDEFGAIHHAHSLT